MRNFIRPHALALLALPAFLAGCMGDDVYICAQDKLRLTGTLVGAQGSGQGTFTYSVQIFEGGTLQGTIAGTESVQLNSAGVFTLDKDMASAIKDVYSVSSVQINELKLQFPGTSIDGQVTSFKLPLQWAVNTGCSTEQRTIEIGVVFDAKTPVQADKVSEFAVLLNRVMGKGKSVTGPAGASTSVEKKIRVEVKGSQAKTKSSVAK